MIVRDFRTENPLLRTPISLLIDDSTPGTNLPYYQAEQLSKNSFGYHFKKVEGKLYSANDVNFSFPIPKTIDGKFVHEFSDWLKSTDVKGKLSITPFPAGLGRLDRSIKGVSDHQLEDFLNIVKKEIMKKFDICPEMLTHTNALDLKTKKLKKGISEWDWSQKQSAKTLAPYIAFAFEILRNAGVEPTGVTSPANFAMFAEGEYVKAILEASKSTRKSGFAWYFMNEEPESLNVQHRLMYLDAESNEAIVSIVVSTRDYLAASQYAQEEREEWKTKTVDQWITNGADSGRIIELLQNGSWITILTHWASLYSNGTRYGFDGLRELVDRINSFLSEKIVWMTCSEMGKYVATSASIIYRVLQQNQEKVIEIVSPFNPKDFTFSFECSPSPSSIFIGLTELKTSEISKLCPNSWSKSDEGRITVCIDNFDQRKGTSFYDMSKGKEDMKESDKLSFVKRIIVHENPS